MRRPKGQSKESVFAFIMEHRRKFSPQGCWLYTGANDGRKGYGQISIDGKYVRVHRLAFEVVNNVILTPDQYVCHRCDVPACFRPYHLFLGTNQDNQIDAARKGRMAGTKLTTRQVKAIRFKYASGMYTQEELGREYGCNHSYIGKITRGKRKTYV